MTRRTTMTAIALASALLVAACGGAEGEEGAGGGASTAATADRSEDAGRSASPSEPAGTSPSTSSPPSSSLSSSGGGPEGVVLRDTSRKTGAARDAGVNDFPELRGVRVGIHETYDRVVFDFDEGTPRFVAEYVDTLHQDGSGEVIPLKGDQDLKISFLRAVPDPDFDDGGKNTPVIRELRLVSYFEGETLFGVGVDPEGEGRAGFRVTTGKDKIILDVAHRAAG
ncbi:AMIN-like domain-containing (lipo)protein [Streptomyces radiopugnans]|uniref:AMIN-like domain-containing (lipo)protein n=1 Tax=Streptomyces radiopugnans TaxID=403935 RepID=UPI003F1ABE8D